MSCGVFRRHSLGPALQWLWCRLAAVAPVLPLAWEPPYAMGKALKRQQKKTQPKIGDVSQCLENGRRRPCWEVRALGVEIGLEVIGGQNHLGNRLLRILLFEQLRGRKVTDHK